ncbi:hypothetical protein, partial [Pseudomonas aeruginosa]|uniref:hypothetical protein n=1 Tax=Pseudomonas aeruginosa TaxID=287 RepID=UPI0027397686
GIAAYDAIDIRRRDRATRLDGSLDQPVEPPVPANAGQVLAHLRGVSAEQLGAGVGHCLGVAAGESGDSSGSLPSLRASPADDIECCRARRAPQEIGHLDRVADSQARSIIDVALQGAGVLR